MSRSITTIAVLCLAVGVAVAAPAGGAADPHHASSADTTAPKAYYGFPAGSVFPSKAVLVGMARDDRKVVAVRVAVKDVATGLWRQKSGGWGPQRTAWKAELSDRGATFATWTHRADLPDGTYRLDVRVEDRAGNTTRLRPRRLFSVDETAPKAALLVAAGDIARCTSDDDEATATLLDGLFAERSGVVAVLGDTAYRDGTASDYADCYDPTWGRHAKRTRATVGNHEYHTSNARAYWDYFGARAGERRRGWYGFDLGAWRIVVVNSNCSEVGGCGPSSPQGIWLAAELEDHPAQCTAVLMHHPRFSSGSEHGDDPAMGPFWKQFHTAGVDLALAGHDHNYERLAKLDPTGHLDRDGGIRSFVVGTGGASLRPVTIARPHSRVTVDDRHGVLALELMQTRYRYSFVTTPGGEVADSGKGSCH